MATELQHDLVAIGLRYVSDSLPGIRRQRRGRGFAFRGPDDRPVAPRQKQRITALVIPPAWQEVWISPWPNGHIQATGRDEKGRKQYIYHPDWTRQRDEAKFDRMLAFGRALPTVRTAVDRDMRRPGLGKTRVVATVVRLLETTLIRVGNREYARSNKSFGLTTLRNRHVELAGNALRFKFRGKSGKEVDLALNDRRVARVVRQLQDLPGQDVFQYLDEDNVRQTVASEDVNEYLREVTGDAFTAKDFRTFAGTVLAAWMLQEFEKVDSQAAAKRNITQAIRQVAQRLGNTVAVCRRSYVHPQVLSAYLDGSLLENLQAEVDQELAEELAGLRPEEAAVLALLRQRLAGELKRRAS